MKSLFLEVFLLDIIEHYLASLMVTEKSVYYIYNGEEVSIFFYLFNLSTCSHT